MDVPKPLPLPPKKKKKKGEKEQEESALFFFFSFLKHESVVGKIILATRIKVSFLSIFYFWSVGDLLMSKEPSKLDQALKKKKEVQRKGRRKKKMKVLVNHTLHTFSLVFFF